MGCTVGYPMVDHELAHGRIRGLSSSPDYATPGSSRLHVNTFNSSAQDSRPCTTTGSIFSPYISWAQPHSASRSMQTLTLPCAAGPTSSPSRQLRCGQRQRKARMSWSLHSISTYHRMVLLYRTLEAPKIVHTALTQVQSGSDFRYGYRHFEVSHVR